MVWIVFGTKDASVRVPGGATVTHQCESCGETTTFYEKDRTSTFRLYFIDVYDYKKHRVMECGACGAAYATDEVPARERERDLPGEIEKKLHAGGEAIGRFASNVGQTLADLGAKVVDRPVPSRAARRDATSRRPADDADLSDDDRAALDELDDLEMKFRALEAEERKKRGG